MDANKLRGKIAECGMTVGEFCNQAVFNRSTFDRKIHGKSDFTVGEMRRIIQVLGLSDNDTRNIFFAETVAEKCNKF